METRANYVAVGSFVLLLLVGVMAAVLWLAQAQFREEYKYYRSFFLGPVTGLGNGAPVRLNGIEVGRVTRLELDVDNAKQVVVTMEIRSEVLIRADAEASLETQGLTGVAYVEIDGGTQASPPLEPKADHKYATIKSKPSSLQRVFNSAPELLAKLVEIGDRLSLLLDDKNRQAIADTLANVRDTTAVFQHRAADMDQVIADTAKTMHNLAAASDKLEATLGKADGAVKDLDGLLQAANKLTADLDAIASDNRKPFNDFANTGLPQVTQLLGELRTLTASLTRVSSELERDPSRLLTGDRRQGYTPH
jgi:phospholipid/cholesterol/gamma-HCH transport system substrate-binding protein